LASFYRFAISRGLVTCSPLPPTAPQQNPPKPPHIYTREELSRLLEATESSQARARQLAAHTLRALLVLLYGAGLRRGEALRLTIADVNLTDRLLLVRETKFHKTRLVPLAPQLARAMERYASRRKLDGASQSSDAPFFANRDGTPLSPGTVSGAFTRLRRAAGVVGAPGERQPNLHGLRHSFCVERLSSWYRQGEDVQRLLPLLSTYLGHSSIAGTQVYLDTIPNLLREASSRFEHYARGATGGTHA
jgi:integrase